MNTLWQNVFARAKRLRFLLIVLTLTSIFVSIGLPTFATSLASSSGKARPLALASISQALLPTKGQNTLATSQSQDVDPTSLIGNPGLFDARPCAALPNSTNCDGIYPSIPPHILPALANQMGASACFDKTSTTVQYLPLDPEKNIATIQLWYFPKCSSWSSQLIFAIPANQIKDVSVEVDEETTNGFILWWDNINELPPTVTAWQASTPKPFGQLSSGEQDFYLNNGIFSPLIYTQGAPMAAEIRLDLTTGTSYDYQTPFTTGK